MSASERYRRELKAFALEVVAPEQSPIAWMVELAVFGLLGFITAVLL